ncbi:MAG TPA: long-chain fatty acid--CoA ligase, partial [Rhodospirillales bacterium]
LKDGTLFAPKYLENKLKFFPYIKEAVTFGHDRDFVVAFVNIDLEAVGDWAERRRLAYMGYTDLAQREQVYELVQGCIAKVNADLALDPQIAGSQIRRFLLLHKELDADDGELTRTRKVRRSHVTEKYENLVNALYSGADHCKVEAQVTFENGRTGVINADLKIWEAPTTPPPAAQARAAE